MKEAACQVYKLIIIKMDRKKKGRMKLCMKMPPDAETVLLQQQETAGDDSCRPDRANNEIIGSNLN